MLEREILHRNFVEVLAGVETGLQCDGAGGIVLFDLPDQLPDRQPDLLFRLQQDRAGERLRVFRQFHSS